MNDNGQFSVNHLAEMVGGRVVGDSDTRIERIANLDTATEHEIAYVDNEKFFDAAQTSRASCLILPKQHPDITDRTFIEVDNPKLAFSIIGAILHPPKHREPSVHPTACIAETADIALTAYIGPGVSVGDYTRVGSSTRIEAGVVIGDN